MNTNLIRPVLKLGRTHYSELEAAAELGVTIEQLRSLVRHHIVGPAEPDGRHSPVTTFQASDLVLLRLLSGVQPGAVRA